MNKEKTREYLRTFLTSEDYMIGFFNASRPVNIIWFFLIGPLAVFGIKSYYVAVSNQGVNFHGLNFLGKFSHNDFFPYEEIESVEIGNGIFQIPMRYKFSNGRKIKLNAQKRGSKSVEKIDANTEMFLKEKYMLG